MGFSKTILFLAILGLIFSIYLIILEFVKADYCPRIVGIPACFIVCVAFAFVLVSLRIKKSFQSIFFFIGAGIGWFLAVWFSVHQILGLDQCPHMLGIPLCYASFALFSILIILYRRYCSRNNTQND